MPEPDSTDALVIGGGPAGLMAAETLAAAGQRVLLAEAKPTVGRKLLMAGKSGLNLTKAEPAAKFAAAFTRGADWVAPIIGGFGPEEVVAWAEGLGIVTFTGSSRRVFPTGMKASPLLRAWTRRLVERGVAIRTRWRWLGWDGAAARFATPEGARVIRAPATILALGGGSWARLGSDGGWTAVLAAEGVAIVPFAPSNVGFRVAWSPAMARHFGSPVKAVRLSAGGRSVEAEFVVSAGGVEGGGIYALADLLRDGAALWLDLAPRQEAVALAAPRPGFAVEPPAQGARAAGGEARAAARMRPRRPRRPDRDGAGAEGAAAAARRPATARRGDLHGRRRRGGGRRRGAHAARSIGGLLRRRDARLGRADGRLPAHGLPRHWPARRTCGATVIPIRRTHLMVKKPR
jgi:hypothetical protein